jgi:hypothetical protein
MVLQNGNLFEYFSKVKDPRRLQGQRHELKHILLLVLMSTMSGYIGYRGIGNFITRNKADLLEALQPTKGRLPSFDAIRAVLINIDFKSVSKEFHNWAKQYISISKNELISIDGKAMKGTLSNGQSIDQHFTSLVSLYCSKQKLTFGNAEVSTSKESEIPVVKQLIEALGLEGITFTLDALHCQKKRPK